MRKCHTAVLCFSLILFALYLRTAHGHFGRQLITSLLGFQWRAVLEHLLAAFALPLLCGISLSVDYRPGNRDVAAIPFQGNTVLAWMRNSGVPGVVLVFAVTYFILQCMWEYAQAFSSVNGGEARGYLQWAQIAADGVGCWLAYQYSVARFGSRTSVC